MIKNFKDRLVPKYTRGASWLMLPSLIAFASVPVFSQESVYSAPDVNIFDSPEQVFEIPGSGDYIGPEEIKKYTERILTSLTSFLAFL